MDWAELLGAEVRSTYAVIEGLLGFVDDADLGWKPATGNNWMTAGQLLRHLASGCGDGVRAFVLGDWGLPDGRDMSELTGEEHLPAAEKLPSVASIAEARELLAKDRAAVLEALERASEERLASENAPAPWDKSEMVLGRRLLQIIEHEKQHKGQLFCYLKLLGKPVGTANLWGTP